MSLSFEVKRPDGTIVVKYDSGKFIISCSCWVEEVILTTSEAIELKAVLFNVSAMLYKDEKSRMIRPRQM